MDAFLAALLEYLRYCLESPSCRFVDNSLAYYENPSEQAQREDKLWFAQNTIISFDELMRRGEPLVQRQAALKGFLYPLLADAYSKQQLVRVAAYELLGHRFVKFPFYAEELLEKRSALHHACLAQHSSPELERAVSEDLFGVGLALRPYNFNAIGLPLDIYTTDTFLYSTAYYPNYTYAHGRTPIAVSQGDCVLDCGACYGDTSLWFACKAGPAGKVIAVEPHPRIIELLRHNLARNPGVQGRVTVVNAATSDTDGSVIPFVLAGAGSHQSRQGEAPEQVEVGVATITIDSLVRELGVETIDCIKMDIEGSELKSLQGAAATLQRHRPKLAISVYHTPSDYIDIPQYIAGLDLGYTFYLDHHFINQWETILYALPDA